MPDILIQRYTLIYAYMSTYRAFRYAKCTKDTTYYNIWHKKGSPSPTMVRDSLFYVFHLPIGQDYSPVMTRRSAIRAFLPVSLRR